MNPKNTEVYAALIANVLVIPETGCWEWQGKRNPYGYGTLLAGKSAGWSVIVSRRMWQAIHGEVPRGLFVCHSCDNPPCCNPAHLWLGTPRDNVRDMHKKGRGGRRGIKKRLLREDRIHSLEWHWIRVLQSYADGVSPKEIAVNMGRSPEYAYAVLAKAGKWVGAANNAHLVAMALRNRVIT